MMPWPVGPPDCTTTSQTLLGGVAGVGSTNVHVAPLSVLIATPQFVPMNTLFGASGRIPMPKAAGSARRSVGHPYAVAGVAVAGCVQVVPPSLLTLMPATLCTLPS